MRPLSVGEAHDDALGVVRPRDGLEVPRERGTIHSERMVPRHVVPRATGYAGKQGVAVVAHGAQPPVHWRRGAAHGGTVRGRERLVAEADTQDGERGAVEQERKAHPNVGGLVGGAWARRDDDWGRR